MNNTENNENNRLYELGQGRERITEKSDVKRRGVWTPLLCIILLFVGFASGVIAEKLNFSTEIMQVQKLKKLSELIDENYYFTDKIDHDAAIENAYETYVGSFGDRFTYYLGKSSYSDFMESMTGNYVGIGVEVTVSEDNFITVTQAFKNGPAAEVGIEAGDRILSVEGIEYSGDELDDAVAVLKGHEGEQVKITIYDLSADSEKELTIERRQVVSQTVGYEMLDNNIGYIQISSFGDTTAKEFKEAYSDLKSKNMSGLLLDLRNNGGGTLDSVVEIADILMPKGEIVKIKYKNADNQVYESDAENAFGGKIVILVNGNTASASELLAGGLRDNNDAVLVGKKTFGKGVVGTLFNVDSESAAVITTGEYFLPNGDNIHGKGIMPQVEVDLPDTVKNIYLLDKKDDTQFKRALKEFE